MLETCPYCSISAGSIIWESRHAFAVWDSSSVSPGRALIVPRRHVGSYFDATSEEKAALWQALDALRPMLTKLDYPESCTVSFETDLVGREPAGHLYVRVTPHILSGDHGRQLTTGSDNPLGPALFRDLEGAVQVDIAVAFVFTAALNIGVFSRLRDVLVRRGSRVRILTGDYQGVTEPAALRLLLTLREQAEATGELRGKIDVRVFQTAKTGSSFHPKAYLLSGDVDGRTIVTYVGSSNLSKTGLFDGVEWNLRLVDTEAAQLARRSFDELFSHRATCEVTHDWINAYELRRPAVAKGTTPVEVPIQEDEPVPVPDPSSIQAAALDALETTREAGNRAGLVVLATGLGKTYLSAFDSTPERGFRRVLFVAHRTEILAQAMATFSRIQPNASVGLYTGEEKAFDATLLFASVQTLSQQLHLSRFAPDHFDYIVVDEFHHAAAATYRRVLDYFEPKFMLGLTATPERTDGGDLLALCDENKVFECGLGTGVRQKLLSPFHYFGVPDLVEYEQIPWRGRGFDEEALTSAVATTARAQNALELLQQHGGKRALGFCVSQRHSDFMRDYFHAHTKLRCASVHSGPSSDSRSRALEQLAEGEIDVLFCVDMFNEGLDVPSIDTVLMLRPTESKVVWLQQLGRGLRRHKDKTHLRVIDYIGNHRSFLEKPAALLAALGVTVTSQQQLTRLLAEKNFDLPPGCEVTYSLQAQQILEKLCPPSRTSQTLREWYGAFKENAARRPTAREALHSGYRPQEVHNDYGSWLEFVREMGDLNATEQVALNANRDFLVALETLHWRKSDELVLLDALRALGKLPGAVQLSELAPAFRHRISRSASLSRHVPIDLHDEPALIQFLREAPIQGWCSRRNPQGQPWFSLNGDTLESGSGPISGSEAFQALAAELIEWRIAEYLSRRPEEAILDVIRDAQGEPILKLNRKRYELPQEWVLVAADSASYRAHYQNQTVDRATRPDGDSNELGALLKGWFGEDAGAHRGKHQVIQKTDAQGSLYWKPMRPTQIVDDNGKAIDATFDCEDFEGEPTIVFHSRGGGKAPVNTEYARGLEVILQRLAHSNVQLTRIALESLYTRPIPLDKRILTIEGFDYPIDLVTVQDVNELRRRIGKAAAATGREQGAKGGGNSTKRLRIWVSKRVEEGALAQGSVN